MAFSVVMPALEMAQETGKLIAWRKQEGDRVTKGEPLLEIETDKAVMEIEAPADGVLAGISAQAGSDIPVGQTIAWIVAPGEKPPAASGSASSTPAARAKIETLRRSGRAECSRNIRRSKREDFTEGAPSCERIGSGYRGPARFRPRRRDSGFGRAGHCRDNCIERIPEQIRQH